MEALRQGVLKVSANKLSSVDGDGFGVTCLSILHRQNDRSVGIAKYAGVGHWSFLEIGSEILDRIGSIAKGFDIAVPLHLPQGFGFGRVEYPLLLQIPQQKCSQAVGKDITSG